MHHQWQCNSSLIFSFNSNMVLKFKFPLLKLLLPLKLFLRWLNYRVATNSTSSGLLSSLVLSWGKANMECASPASSTTRCNINHNRTDLICSLIWLVASHLPVAIRLLILESNLYSTYWSSYESLYDTFSAEKNIFFSYWHVQMQ